MCGELYIINVVPISLEISEQNRTDLQSKDEQTIISVEPMGRYIFF